MEQLESEVLCLKYCAARAQTQPFKKPKVMIKHDITCYGWESHVAQSHRTLRGILSYTYCTVLHAPRPVLLISVHRCHLFS